MTAQTVTSAVATRDKDAQLVTWLRKQQDDIAMAAASHVKPSAVIRVTQGALRRDPKLLAAAIANPQSLLYALLDCARLGHEPDTDDYYLVPFGSEVTGIEGYKGIIERMYRAGGVSSVVAQVVRRTDRYAPRGENTPPLHEYDDFASPEERGPMRGAYAYAIFPDGHCSQVIRMGRAEIMEHKAASRGSNRSDSPWQVWEPAMWKKTVLRALEPYVPTSTEYRNHGNAAPVMAEPAVFHRIEHNGASSEIVEAEIVEDGQPDGQEPPKNPPRDPRGKTAAAGDDTRSRPRSAGAPAPAQDGTTGVSTAQNARPRAAGAAPSRGAQPLPPLPAEDKTPAAAGSEPAEPAEPGTDRHRKLVGIVRGHFKRLGYTDDDDTQRLEHTARLARTSEIGSTNDLDEDELKVVADTLARCKNIEKLTELLNAIEAEAAGQDGAP